MESRSTLTVIGIIALISAIGEIGQYVGLTDSEIMWNIIAVSIFFTILFIIRDGTLLRTETVSRVLFVFAGITFIGACFKILHWSLANILLLIGYSGLLLSYLVRFILKPVKKLFDVSKMLWAGFVLITLLLYSFHFSYKDYFFAGISLSYVLMVFCFVKKIMHERTRTETD